MKLVPHRKIIFGIILAVVITLVILLVIQSQPQPEDKPPVNNNISERDEIQYSDAQALGSSSLLVMLYMPFFTFIYIVLGSILALGFKTVINRGELQQMVNTSLKLAGFNYTIPILGRSWKINDQVLMKFEQSSVYIRVKQQDSDPREYGLRSIDGWGETRCNLSSLQLTLQTIRLYLNN